MINNLNINEEKINELKKDEVLEYGAIILNRDNAITLDNVKYADLAAERYDKLIALTLNNNSKIFLSSENLILLTNVKKRDLDSIAIMLVGGDVSKISQLSSIDTYSKKKTL